MIAKKNKSRQYTQNPIIRNGHIRNSAEFWGKFKKRALGRSNYTQYPIIRNGLIRNGAEFWGKFKKRALGQSNLRNASKNLRNAQCSDFQI